MSLIAGPPAADDALLARMLTDVCLPYATRAQTFEKSIRVARDLRFRRPVGDAAPLEEWASEVVLVSADGVWRLKIEEGSIEEGEVAAYATTCTISSRRASARELADMGRRAFGDEARWTSPRTNAWRWDRRVARPEENGLAVEVAEQQGERPTMTVRGSYY